MLTSLQISMASFKEGSHKRTLQMTHGGANPKNGIHIWRWTAMIILNVFIIPPFIFRCALYFLAPGNGTGLEESHKSFLFDIRCREMIYDLGESFGLEFRFVPRQERKTLIVFKQCRFRLLSYTQSPEF